MDLKSDVILRKQHRTSHQLFIKMELLRLRQMHGFIQRFWSPQTTCNLCFVCKETD